MRLVYNEGPDKVTMGIAGLFRRGESREVEDGLAEGLLKKTSIKFKEVKSDSTADKPAQAGKSKRNL